MIRGIEVDSIINGLSRRQYGLIHDDDAVAAGLSRSQLRRRIEGGTLVRVRPRVSRLVGVPQSWEQKQLATCMWAGHGWVSSGLAAANLWELDGVNRRRIEISGAGRLSGRPPGVVVHERCSLLPGDTTTIKGIPITSAARTIIDLASLLDPCELERAFESALRKRLLTAEYLMRRMRRLGTRSRKGIRNLVEILVGRGDAPSSDSDFEVLLLQVLRAAGLPQPEMQQEIYDEQGFVARVDFIYRLARLIIEADSYKHHGGREDWENDNDKRSRLVAYGYRILPITWRTLTTRPGEVQSLARRALRTSTP